jgi:hypothetical protein
MSSERRSVTLGNESIEYNVVESADATEPRIDVDIHGVTVILPEGSDEAPQALIEENRGWVLEKKHKYDRYREQIPERRFEEGETFPYLDEPHEVVVEQRPASAVADGELRLARHHVEQTSIKRALESLYRRTARDRFEERASHYSEQMGVEYERIDIRNQRTKWGSCSASGTLGLNWRLMMAPPGVIDYVVIHELAHLQEANHTSGFWALVAEYDPDYTLHATWLDEHSSRLVFSENDI